MKKAIFAFALVSASVVAQATTISARDYSCGEIKSIVAQHQTVTLLGAWGSTTQIHPAGYDLLSQQPRNSILHRFALLTQRFYAVGYVCVRRGGSNR